MSWWELALWGLVGGVVVDGIDFYIEVRAAEGILPTSWRRPAMIAAEIIRLGCGIGLAVGLGLSDQIVGPAGAIAVGAAAPLIAEKLSQGALNKEGGSR